jgi:RNA polymerase sigma-70 factor, ECF subfamily
VREAAQVVGCSLGAFRVRLHRARRKLARRLDAAKPIDHEGRAAVPGPVEEAR